MRKYLLFFSFLIAFPAVHAAPPTAPSGWKARVSEAMPLLGHRNWILVVDSAYPLQTSPGVETIETNSDQVDVVQYVLDAISNSIHVRPIIYMDPELPFVPDEDAPGASVYRTQIATLLQRLPGLVSPARPDHRQHRQGRQGVSGSGPQDKDDRSLHLGLRPPRLQVPGARMPRSACARRWPLPGSHRHHVSGIAESREATAWHRKSCVTAPSDVNAVPQPPLL